MEERGGNNEEGGGEIKEDWRFSLQRNVSLFPKRGGDKLIIINLIIYLNIN